MHFFTDSINLGENGLGAPEHYSAFGARSFPNVITTSNFQDWNEKGIGGDYMMSWLSIYSAHIQNVSSTKRLLDKTSPRQNISKQNVYTHNVSLTKRLLNETSPVTKRLRNKTSP
jgi:hypothetical protein